VAMERRDGKLLFRGMQFVPRNGSLAAENDFTLSGKGSLHYAVLALAVAVPLFIVYALVLCIRTKFERRKWLWGIFVLVGLVQFPLNWSTGETEVTPVSFQVLGAGVMKAGPAAPWMLTVSMPVGAIVFLLRRRRLRLQAAAGGVESRA